MTALKDGGSLQGDYTDCLGDIFTLLRTNTRNFLTSMHYFCEHANIDSEVTKDTMRAFYDLAVNIKQMEYADNLVGVGVDDHHNAGFTDTVKVIFMTQV